MVARTGEAARARGFSGQQLEGEGVVYPICTRVSRSCLLPYGQRAVADRAWKFAGHGPVPANARVEVRKTEPQRTWERRDEPRPAAWVPRQHVVERRDRSHVEVVLGFSKM